MLLVANIKVRPKSQSVHAKFPTRTAVVYFYFSYSSLSGPDLLRFASFLSIELRESR